MLDEICKERTFEEGNEQVRICEFEKGQDTINLKLSEIQNLTIYKNSGEHEPRFTIAFETEVFRVFIQTDVINASELYDLASFIEKDDLARFQKKE